MRAWLARLVWKLAQWLGPRDVLTVPPLPPALMVTAAELVARAEQFADGTSGEYRRAWVFNKLLKRHPGVSKRTASLAIELVLLAR